ncbi:hypothetical protein NPIL_382681 [Nephila pilipes]|uniref:Uncharacterized protein n=1 Tax=Nephila pilipes TaxID=299642 RepID=A0A8X6QCE1_NEPPI|nr:hypothetical protein NPIL_382681 [Nephila pilipes]
MVLILLRELNFSPSVRAYLHTFPDRGSIINPSPHTHSPYLFPLDFFSVGYGKPLVYGTLVTTRQTLVFRHSIVIAKSLYRRCDTISGVV